MAQREPFPLFPGWTPIEEIILAYRRGETLPAAHAARLESWARSEPYVQITPREEKETP